MQCNNTDEKVTHHKGGRDIGGEEVHKYIFCQQDCCSELCKPTNRKKKIFSHSSSPGQPSSQMEFLSPSGTCFLKHSSAFWLTLRGLSYKLHGQGNSFQAVESETALAAAAWTVQGTAVPHPNKADIPHKDTEPAGRTLILCSRTEPTSQKVPSTRCLQQHVWKGSCYPTQSSFASPAQQLQPLSRKQIYS